MYLPLKFFKCHEKKHQTRNFVRNVENKNKGKYII